MVRADRMVLRPHDVGDKLPGGPVIPVRKDSAKRDVDLRAIQLCNDRLTSGSGWETSAARR
jgi:hypothetical protein